MKYQGATVFLVFFGISLLDALWGGHWIRAFFWVGIGLVFVAFDLAAHRRSTRSGTPTT